MPEQEVQEQIQEQENPQEEPQAEPKTGRRVIFKDGTTIENGSAGYSAGCLWLNLPGYTMAQAAALVFDPEKTDKIVYEYGQMSDEYEGFTNCTSLFVEVDSGVNACLQRGNPSV